MNLSKDKAQKPLSAWERATLSMVTMVWLEDLGTEPPITRKIRYQQFTARCSQAKALT